MEDARHILASNLFYDDGHLTDMTSNQYRKAIEAIGLSQHRAARFLGVSPRTSQGYALGEYPVPESVAKLLRLMVRLNIKPDDVK